jgi:hypothetical protein
MRIMSDYSFIPDTREKVTPAASYGLCSTSQRGWFRIIESRAYIYQKNVLFEQTYNALEKEWMLEQVPLGGYVRSPSIHAGVWWVLS